jgi:hypothetical protein
MSSADYVDGCFMMLPIIADRSLPAADSAVNSELTGLTSLTSLTSVHSSQLTVHSVRQFHAATVMTVMRLFFADEADVPCFSDSHTACLFISA